MEPELGSLIQNPVIQGTDEVDLRAGLWRAALGVS